jgi:hypothetical protein
MAGNTYEAPASNRNLLLYPVELWALQQLKKTGLIIKPKEAHLTFWVDEEPNICRLSFFKKTIAGQLSYQ